MTDEVERALIELQGEVRHLNANILDYIVTSKEMHRDHEARIRTLEGVIHAVEKLGGIEQRVCSVEEQVGTITASMNRRRGAEMATQALLSLGAGLVGAVVAIVSLLRGSSG